MLKNGLANSLTSPISREAAEKFTKALNHLLSGKNTRLSVGNTADVFWTRKPEEIDLLAAIENPDPQVVKNLLDSASKGQEVYGTDVNQFYALALSASVARAVVRDWLETTVPIVKANLKLWFLAHKITDTYGEVGKPLGVYALAASAYRDATKEMLPKVPTALIRNALQHLPIPDDLLTRAVQRNHAEGKVTYPRAALIKLALTTKLGTDAIADMEQMNPQPNLQAQDDRAYHCGRLLAELEGLQFDVTDGNPNGDPDVGNLPRTASETSHGLVTDVCLKRKIRNYIATYAQYEASEAEAARLKIFVEHHGVLNDQIRKAYVS